MSTRYPPSSLNGNLTQGRTPGPELVGNILRDLAEDVRWLDPVARAAIRTGLVRGTGPARRGGRDDDRARALAAGWRRSIPVLVRLARWDPPPSPGMAA